MSDSTPTTSTAAGPALRVGVKIGLLGGIVAVLIALQGMLQAFVTRDIIGGVVSMSIVLLLITYFLSAYVAVTRSGATSPLLILVIGVLSGILSSALVVVLVLVGGVVRLGTVFINATPQLYDIVTFKTPQPTGSFYILLLGVACGAGAAFIHLLPAALKRAIVYGLVTVVTVGLLQELIRVTLSDFSALAPLTKFLFLSNGLSISGAETLFVIVALTAFLWALTGTQVRAGYARLPRASRRGIRWGVVIFGILIALALPALLGLYLSEVLDNVALYLLMGLGLNIVVGFAGLLDLGYVAFFAIGAYTVGILTSPEHATGIIHNWWLALPFAVIVAVFAGVVLGVPVLKMRGDYLAIVTLGFGEIIRLLALSDFLKPWEGGAQGIQGIPLPNIAGLTFGPSRVVFPVLGQVQWGISQQFYYLLLAGCVLVMFIATRLKGSRLGRAWMAIREDEDVAQAMGIDLVATKLMAFGMGASFGGLAGAIFASKLQSVYPQNLTFLISVYVLAVIIVGGMGSIPGVIVGALALAGLPELLREVGDYRYLFFGAGLVIMMLVRPEGILPEARRRQELEEFKEEPESAGKAVPVKTVG